MNIILFGPPGAGKGTQANLIIKEFNLVQISSGDLLRDEILKKTNLGKKIEVIINSGDLVSDHIVNELLEEKISDKRNQNRLIFDGYPRNLSQIKFLKQLLIKYNQKIPIIISLHVEKKIIEKRIKGRIYCTKCKKIFNEYLNPPNKMKLECKGKYLEKRLDDNIDTIVKRYDTYVQLTKPVIEYYKKNSTFHYIDGNKKIDEISNEIRGILLNLTD